MRLVHVLAAVVLVAPTLTADGTSEDAQRLVVGFDTVPAEVVAGGEWNGAAVVSVNGLVGYATVLAASPEVFRLRAGADPRVTYVEVPTLMRPVSHAGVDLSGHQRALLQIHAEAAGPLATSVPVCVVDSGIVPHPDLPVVAPGSQRDFVEGDAVADDELGHGTAVAGILAATRDHAHGGIDGLGVPLLVAKVFDEEGVAPDDRVADAITWCAARPGPVVVSMSLGSTGPPTTALASAVRFAWGQGALLVAAAGNAGCAPCVAYPAAFPEVVAVACTDRVERVCSFSSGGPEVEIAAPGAAVLTTTLGGGYAARSGTSFSTPYVAGAAALAWERHGGRAVSNEDLRKLLGATAQRFPGLASGATDPKHGAGELDLACLLAMNVDCGGTAPTLCPRPDARGYRCEPAARPVLPAAGWTAAPAGVPVELGFEFHFADTKQTSVYLQPGGRASFLSAACPDPCDAQTFPDARAPNGLIAAGWSDALAHVEYARFPGDVPRFAARWFKPASTAPAVELVLDAISGDVYVTVRDLADAVVGIEDAHGTSGLTVPPGAFPGTVRFASPGALPPGAPLDLVASARPGQPFLVDLGWSPPDDESGSPLTYDVRRSLAEEDATPFLLHPRWPGTEFTDEVQRSCRGCRTGGAGDVLWYTVRATNAAGEGPGARVCVRASAPTAAGGCADLLPNGVFGS